MFQTPSTSILMRTAHTQQRNILNHNKKMMEFSRLSA
uniref:Uncharacterized protein n=1 Tax=Arundo donax TaxID=35708 RepID=A0A0A9HCW6_ARUDO